MARVDELPKASLFTKNSKYVTLTCTMNIAQCRRFSRLKYRRQLQNEKRQLSVALKFNDFPVYFDNDTV